MSEKRRDNKGRILKDGEIQRKDGKYEYKYFDINGKRRSIYSWKLVDTDKIPNGKRDCSSLRDMEKRISRDVVDGIDTFKSDRTTLNDLYDSYIESKTMLRQSTLCMYNFMYSKHIRNSIGNKKVSNIKYSDILKLYISLINDGALKVNSVILIQKMLHPVFELAVRDGMIRNNPTDGVIDAFKCQVDIDTEKRHPLTIQQQDRLVDFLSKSKKHGHWLTLITVLLGTGMRIGEATGLTWNDCDLKSGMISVNHMLSYRPQESGKCGFKISPPKTRAGNRVIPMLSGVRSALISERERQLKHGCNKFEIDGYSGFVFGNIYNKPLNAQIVDRALRRIISDANKEEKINAKKESRDPILLPKFSCHHLRHTFCTRMCENETNVKVIQEIMGHSNIGITMNIYSEATMDKKKSCFDAIDGKFRIS